MRGSSILFAAVLLASCASEPAAVEPAKTAEGRLCARAYGSMVDSISEIATKQGVDMPSMPDKDAYVQKCYDAGFTADQAKCLDPKIQGVDASCKETLEPVKAKADELTALFKDAMQQKAEEPADAEAGEGEAAEGEAAEGEAAEGAADGEGAGGEGEAVKKALE